MFGEILNFKVIMKKETKISKRSLHLRTVLHYNLFLIPSTRWCTFTVYNLLHHQGYNSGTVLAFPTISFHVCRSWTRSDHFTTFSFFRSLLTSSSHLDLGLPTGQFVNGCHLYIFFKIIDSGFLFMCPNQLNL